MSAQSEWSAVPTLAALRLASRIGDGGVPWALRVPSGRDVTVGAGTARFTVIPRSMIALLRLLFHPTILGLGNAFIAGRLDVEGDLLAAVEAAHRIGGASSRPAGRTINRWRRRGRAAWHYDVSNEFFALFLDSRMVYTCAYYTTADTTLEAAQEAKLELVCRKLDLRPGDSVLDVGCGWGGFVAWATGRHGVRATGITVSPAQAGWAARMLAQMGLADRARVELSDYRAFAPSIKFDKVAAIGVIEHVGIANYDRYFGAIHEALVPRGLFLNHGITHPTTSPRTPGMDFLDRHVFPGGDLASLDHTVSAIRAAGFDVLHVEALGPHYARTTREWLARLIAARDRAVALVGDRTTRIWLAYLAAASVSFAAGWIDVHQILARRD